MRWRGPMAVQQEAGPYSALGRIKFEMDDRFDVYLHDTPEKWRFQAADRMMSHGCVRVEDPRELASLLLGESPEKIDQGDCRRPDAQPSLAKADAGFYRLSHRGRRIGWLDRVSRRPLSARSERVWAYLNRARELPAGRKIRCRIRR